MTGQAPGCATEVFGGSSDDVIMGRGGTDLLGGNGEAWRLKLAAFHPLRRVGRHALVGESSVIGGSPWPGTGRVG